MMSVPEPVDRPETCVVCFKNVDYYSVGECDHPVCYECSTRMRVLCLQNECPICRQMLSQVVFTEDVQPYKELRNRVFSEKLFERQYKIAFCSEQIKQAYERILEHRCKFCLKLPPFRSFNLLSDHVRKTHEKFYCDLCVKHLKIFTSERKCYTRQDLATHRRKGDADDTSHRGHPLCEFCEERYMDNDELYRHLRKDHLYCHLCDADGRNLYYSSHTALAQHFRQDHFLCEEGECAGDHLTAVFRSDIDLKAHKALVHGRGLPRAAARQARTLEVQFNITPHQFPGRQQRSEGGGGRERETERAGSSAAERETAGSVSVFVPPSAPIDTGSVEQFPSLSAAAPAPPSLAAPSKYYQGTGGIAKTKENFPALDSSVPRSAPTPAPTPRGPPAAALLRTNGKPNVSIQLHSQPNSASNFRLTGAGGARISAAPHAPPASAPAQYRRSAFYEDFPSLSVPEDDRPALGAATPQPPKVALVSSEQVQTMKASQPSQPTQPRPRLDLAEAFPALSASRAPVAPPQWITVAKPKEKIKPSKVAPAPKLSNPTFNPVADFPQLNTSKANNKTPAPQSNSVVSKPPEEIMKNVKKEKKKQNIAKIIALENAPSVNGVTSKKKTSSAWDSKKIGKENKSAQSEGDSVAEKREELTNGDINVCADDFPALSKRSGGVSGMTFTNSAGETFPAPLHSYTRPPDFERRNVALVQSIADALGPSQMNDFKNLSRAFRTGGVSAEEFYNQCQKSLGPRLKELFPELVALLPDIGKQQALVVGREVGLDMCAACGQMLKPADAAPHRTAHWPGLAPR